MAHNNLRIFVILFCILNAVVSSAQQDGGRYSDIRYVDFHAHTSMKNYNRDVYYPNMLHDSFFLKHNDISNWSGTKHRKHFGAAKKFSGFTGKYSYPQASWDMVANLHPQMICTSITPLEKRFVSGQRISVLFLRPKIRFINRLAVTKLNMGRQRVIYDGSSFDEFMAEYRYMTMQRSHLDSNVRLVRNRADLDSVTAHNGTGLLLTVEGAHSLMGSAFIHKEFQTDFGINDETIHDIYRNIDTLKHLPHEVFFMTLSHMQWNSICGHAKSLDMKSKFVRWVLGYQSDEKEFRRLVFKKFTSGIADSLLLYNEDDQAFINHPCSCTDRPLMKQKAYGWEVIRKLLDKSDGQHRILIDMRHMDLKSRWEYIRFARGMRDTVLYGPDTVIGHCHYKKDSVHVQDPIPIIISHAAVSGKTYRQAKLTGSCPFADRYLEVSKPKKFYKLYETCFENEGVPKINLDTTGWFHPFSINLFDEEIKYVYETDGIIGITLEERVLGNGRPNYFKHNHYGVMYDFFNTEFHGRWNYSYDELKAVEPFMRNLLYIVRYSDCKDKKEAWKHVAIGSDFDGMIDPIDVCPTVNDIPHLYRLLEYFLPTYAKFNKDDDLLGPDYVGGLTEALNDLFYKNGEEFIKKYYGKWDKN